MPSDRARQLRFMREFGPHALRNAVLSMFDGMGAAWLTDEQLSEIVSQQVADWRFTQRLNRRNRAKNSA